MFHVLDPDFHGGGRVLMVAVLVGRDTDLDLLATGLAHQGFTHVGLSLVEVNRVAAARLLTAFCQLLDGHHVAGLNGALHALETGVALTQIGQGLFEHLICDFRRLSAQSGGLPVSQNHLRVGFAAHPEVKTLTVCQRARIDAGVHQIQLQLAGRLRVMNLQQPVTHLALDVSHANALCQHAAGGLAGAKTGNAHVSRDGCPHLLVGPAHLIRGNRDLKLHLVAVLTHQFCHVPVPPVPQNAHLQLKTAPRRGPLHAFGARKGT